MGEPNNRAVVLDVCDILDRLGISRESIAHLIEAGKEIATNPADRHVPRVQSE